MSRILRNVALIAGTALALATLPPPSSLAEPPSPEASASQPPSPVASASQGGQGAGGTVALTNARIIDGTGRPPIDRGTIVIANGRITAVGPAASVTVPAGAQRIDATGKTIVPGFINAHAHLNVQRGATLPVRDDLIRRLKMYANYGVTTTVSLGSTEADELEGIKLMQEQEHPGLDRARLYTAGLNAEGKTPEEARKSVDRLAGLKVHAIKFHINGTPNDMNRPTWSAIIDESKKKGLTTAVHIYYLKDAKAAIEDGVNILAHSVRDQDVDAALISAMKQKNVSYIPTLTRDLSVFAYETTPDFFKDPFFLRGMALYKEEVTPLSTPESQERIRKNPTTAQIKKAIVQAERNVKLLNDAGVTIAMGTDSGAGGNPGRWQGYFEQVEMEMMNKAGMSPMQVIVASTNNAAKIFGLNQVGTLQAGKWADLVVLNANPLESIRNTRTIDSVWIAGARVPNVAPVTQTK
jgi:imidazolonepropionase-like amidohydrolase